MVNRLFFLILGFCLAFAVPAFPGPPRLHFSRGSQIPETDSLKSRIGFLQKLAQNQWNRDQRIQARASYQEALAMVKPNPVLLADVQLNYGEFLLRNGAGTEAINFLNSLPRTRGNREANWLRRFNRLLGDAYQQTGNLPAANQSFRQVLATPTLSEPEKLHVLSLLLINSLKLNYTENVKDYYLELQRMGAGLKSETTRPEVLLALGMHQEFRKQKTLARKIFLRLGRGAAGEPASEFQVEGLIRLANLYSQELNRDSAEYFFQLTQSRFFRQGNYQPQRLLFSRFWAAHQQRFQKTDVLIQALNQELRRKDSLYHQELVHLTRDLEYRYKISESEKQVRLLAQQRQLEALRYARNRQRSQLVILGLSFLIVSIIFLTYILYQRRKQAGRLHTAQMAILARNHRLEVIRMLADAQETERRRIADQLHDEVGSMLSVARLNLSAVREMASPQDAGQVKRLQTAEHLLGDVAGTIREMSHELMPVAIRQFGLRKAIEQLVADINTAGTIQVESLIFGLEELNRFPEEFQVNIYRIIQELLQNILKHARATHALLELIEHPDQLNLMVEDNGCGFPEHPEDFTGKGLKLIATRIEYLEGRMRLEKNHTQGTLIVLEIPTPLKLNLSKTV